MNTKLVSVVIPAKDAGAYLREAILSAVRQEGVRVECIVIDDGSTDHPERIVDEVNGTVANAVRLMRNDSNRGRCHSRNAGVAAAAGDVIAFLDADDRYLPGHLAGIVAALRAQSECVYTLPTFIDEAGRRVASSPLPPDPTREWILAGRIPYTSGIALTRRVWNQCGPFDPSLDEREDWDLFIRVFRNGVDVTIDRRGTVEVRRHPGNHSRTSERFLRDTLVVAERAEAAASLEPPRTRRRAVAKMLGRVAETCASRPCPVAFKRAGFTAAVRSVRTWPRMIMSWQWLRTFGKLVLSLVLVVEQQRD